MYENNKQTAVTIDTANQNESGTENMRWKTLRSKAALSEVEKKYKGTGACLISTSLSPDDDTEIELNFVFKKPGTASYDRYVKTASVSSSKALKTFIKDNIIEEQKEDLELVNEEYPAVSISVGEKLLYMLGLSKDTSVKKL